MDLMSKKKSRPYPKYNDNLRSPPQSKKIQESEDDKTIRRLLIEKGANIRTSDYTIVNRRLAAVAGRDQIFLEDLSNTLGKVFSKGWYSPKGYAAKVTNKHAKWLQNVLVSDTHFGAKIDPQECPVGYDSVQESRRFGKVCSEMADVTTEKRQDTTLNIHILGDLIQNQLHDPRDGEPMSWQFAAALQYHIQMVMFLATHYPWVRVFFAEGNHGRNMSRHPDKATSAKWDSIERMIFFALKTAVLNAGVKNCEFFMPLTPYYIAPLFENKLFGTHGDTVLKTGSVGRTINVGNMDRQIAKWNSVKKIGAPFSVFAVGHIHVASCVYLPGKVTLFTNGALVPPDPYSLTINAPDNTCCQWRFESTPTYPVGDRCPIDVADADEQPKYNDFVKPFRGF